MASRQTIQARVESVIMQRFGRVETDLVEQGIVDSLGAMELLVLLQKEFEVRLGDVMIADLATVPRIAAVVEAALAAEASPAAS